MIGDARRWTWGLMVALLVVGATVGSAQSIRVLVDGDLLVTSAPPREVGGRIMVGMRDIFERLGADVKWDAAERRITAMRGPRTVVLWIGRNAAYVDEAMIGLDVPPMLIGGYTYVPVRFPSEALGANVGWLSATRTVMIDTSTMPPLEGGPPPGPGPGPGPVTPPTATTAKGSFLQLVAATPRVILARSYETEAVETHLLTANAVFQRGEASAAVLPVVQPEALLKGDDLKLMLNAAGQVERVEARSQLSQITFHAAAANSLMADTGQFYSLAADVVITREGAGPTTLAGLGAGEKLVLRQNPVTGAVWEITAPKGTAPPPPAPTAGPQILMIGAEGYTKPLKQNETLVVKLQGSPGGTATFDIGAAVKGQKLTEAPAGVYSGSYRVRATDEIVDAKLIGRLVVGGKAAPVGRSEDPVSLDAVAPTVEEYTPADQAVLNANRPVIQVRYSDGDGVGIDLQSVRLYVGGEEVTGDCTITDESLTYYAPELPDGQYRVQFSGQDLAGNPLPEARWAFKVDTKTAPSVITAVSHSPAGATLNNGATLTVTLFGAPQGKSASFDIVGLEDGIAMTRQGAATSKEWRGTYTVKAGDNVTNAVIRGRFIDKNNVAHVLEDPQHVTIDARVQSKLVIQEPKDKAAVGESFTVRGLAAPNRKVTYEVTYEGRSRLLGARVTGDVDAAWVKSDANGKWSFDIDTAAVRNNVLLKSIDKFVIKCTMAGAAGAAAQTVQISVLP